MTNSFVFGMLLAVAAMLFLASGFSSWNQKDVFTEGAWRSVVNVMQGFLLIGVIIFPCTVLPNLHLVVALLFFIGCGLTTLLRETKAGRRIQHRVIDFTPLVLMALAMSAHFLKWPSSWPFNQVNLFGAESIALWITGLDFILISLKREMYPQVNIAEKAAALVEEGG